MGAKKTFSPLLWYDDNDEEKQLLHSVPACGAVEITERDVLYAVNFHAPRPLSAKPPSGFELSFKHELARIYNDDNARLTCRRARVC